MIFQGQFSTAAERAKRARVDAVVSDHLSLLEAHADPDVVASAREKRAALVPLPVGPKGWDYFMVGRVENEAVVFWLVERCPRPLVAVRLWAAMLRYVSNPLGFVDRTRDQLAADVGVHPGRVSTLISIFEKQDFVTRHVERLPGVKGPGRVWYRINPNIATCLSGDEPRAIARAAAPSLKFGPIAVPTEGRRRAAVFSRSVL